MDMLMMKPRQDPASEWRTVLDNLLIELISALFINMVSVMCWGPSDLQPAIVLGLVMICIKDQDYFFPDGSWTVTIVMWTLGGYGSWTHVAARLLGQTCAFGVAAWMLNAATVNDLALRVEQPKYIVCCFEALTTLLEHMAVVYVVMPLLPPSNYHGTNFMFPSLVGFGHFHALAIGACK